MSRKIYDYDKCYEIAKHCSSPTEMKVLNGSAYNVANRNRWIKDYIWFAPKHHKPYTYDEVFEIAKNYNCSSDFQKGNGSAYGKAREKGWIKDYTWFRVKQHSPYTYEECYEIAKNYRSKVALAKGNVGAYQAARNHGWIDDYTWFESKQNPSKYWTKERVMEESKKYRNRGEFHDKCGTAYGKARVNGWLDEFTWLKDDRIDFSSDKIDSVYAYEFKEHNSVYVGRTLTRRVQDRDKEHLFTDTDAVFLFAKEKDIPVPTMRILEENLTLAEGVAKEEYYLEYYRKNGWSILNRTKTGSVGLIARNKWTKKTCREEALKYKRRSDFSEYCSRAYEISRLNGWLDDYSWFEENQKPNGYWDNYDNCYKAASECKTRTEFSKKYNRAYTKAKENNWFNDYTWFNIERVAHNKKWDYNTVLEEARKYKSKNEFSKKARGAYKVALANKWMASYDWFEDTHVLLSNGLKKSWDRRKAKENEK